MGNRNEPSRWRGRLVVFGILVLAAILVRMQGDGLTGMATGEDGAAGGCGTAASDEAGSNEAGSDEAVSALGAGDRGHTLRLMTYNVQCLTTVKEKGAVLGGPVGEVVGDAVDTTDVEGDMRRKATKTADAILKAHADVVALNEVFSTYAREEFLRVLGPIYPYRVEKLDDMLDGEDSGLMLFSKFRLGHLPNEVVKATNFDKEVTNGSHGYNLSFWE